MVFSRANPLISTILDKNIYLNERCVVYLDSTVIICVVAKKNWLFWNFPPHVLSSLQNGGLYLIFFSPANLPRKSHL